MSAKPDLHIDVDAAQGQAEDEHEFDGEDDDMYSDESSAEGEIDPDIDFNVMYALHTFVATVDGQASVVKGDSMVLLDDSNSYWWLVNVLKADEVGYIPAENIETPNDRLARLNKMRNVEIAASTMEEKNLGRLKLRNIPSEGGHGRPQSVMSMEPDPNRRGVKFGEPTYVEHSGSGEDWSSEEDSEGELQEGDFQSNEEGHQAIDSDDDFEEDQGEPSRQLETRSEGGPLQGEDGASYEEHSGLHGMMMEPDDGMSWEDDAVGGPRQLEDANVEPDPDSSITSQSYWDGLQPVGSESSHQSSQSHASDPSLSFESHHTQDDDPTLTGPAALDTQSSPSSTPTSPRGQVSEPARILLPSEQFNRAMSPAGPSSEPIRGASPYGQPANATSSQQSLAKFASREDFFDAALEHPGETRRISATPPVARRAAPLQSFITGEPYEIDESQETMPRNFSSSSLRSDGADSQDSNRKDSFDRNSPSQNKKPRRAESEDDKGKKKVGGVFGSLFKKKGERREKGARSPGGLTEGDSFNGPSDDESSSRPQSTLPGSPIGARPGSSASEDPKRSVASPPPVNSSLANGPGSPSVSPHALRLQQQDQKTQAAYQRYLTSSTRASTDLSPASLSYGTQAAATVAQSSATQRIARASIQSNRPPSLIISNSNLNSGSVEASAGGQAFAVLRVFAGDAVESDATFKTVLLKDSTSTAELLKQAMQRFGLGLGRQNASSDYILTVKGFDGDESVLGLDAHPLKVFNELSADDTVQAPLVRQSSIGSITSVSSNLTLNPAISRLGDWLDDSVVKLYLHRSLGQAPSNDDVSPRMSTTDSLGQEPMSPGVGSSSANRFALQIIVHPQDLPEGMSFDPSSEALLAARRRSSQFNSPSLSAPSSPNLSQTERRRLFLLPANTTVAEAIETSLDRFGIAEGVVDGGDEVEEKLSNRKSITRIRYSLAVKVGGQERILQPSAKLIDVYDTPPLLRTLPGSTDAASRRRSREIPEARPEDIGTSDPVFVLRKAIPRETPPSSVSSRRRSRLSATMEADESGLQRRNSLQIPSKDGSRRLSTSSEASRRSTSPSLSGPEGASSILDSGSGSSDKTATHNFNPSTDGFPDQSTPQASRSASRQRTSLDASRDVVSSASQHQQQASISSASTLSRSTPDSSALARSQNLNGSGSTTHPASQPTPNPTTPITSVSRGNSRADTARTGRPVVTNDDFGISNMMAVIRARARESLDSRRKSSLIVPAGSSDVVDKLLFGEKMADGGPGWEGKRGLVELQGRLDDFDKELDRLLDSVLASSKTETASHV